MDKSKFSPRLNYSDLAREGLNNLSGLETYIHANLEPGLIELVKLRPDQWLRLLHRYACQGCPQRRRKRAASLRPHAWRKPYYTARERAALEWTRSPHLDQPKPRRTKFMSA